MESVDVVMTALIMKHRGGLSRRALSGSKWLFMILTVIFSAWRPVTADKPAGKV